jgi:hypothetical protein
MVVVVKYSAESMEKELRKEFMVIYMTIAKFEGGGQRSFCCQEEYFFITRYSLF